MSRKKGWVIPGHKWTGPGNDPYIGPLTSLTDYISRDHDIDYELIEEKYGVNPKYYWTKADEVAIKHWTETGEWSGAAAAWVFKVKKFLNKVGVIPGLDMTKKDSIVEYTVDSSGASKRLRFETPNQPPKKPRGQTLDTDSKRKSLRKPAMPKKLDMDIDNEGTTPIATQAAVAATTANKNGRMGSAGETPISPYDFVQIGIPKTITTRLPFRLKTTRSLPTNTAPLGLAFRTNSIYDVVGSAAYVANPAATADGAVTPFETPKWRKYFTDRYAYWTVLGCDYKVMFRQTQTNASVTVATANPQEHAEYDVFMYKAGLQKPPLLSPGSTQMVPKEWKLMHTGVEYDVIEAITKEITYSTTGSTPSGVTLRNNKGKWTVFQGHCGPNTYNHEVVEDELAQRWHKTSEVPPTPEQLIFHIQPGEWNFGTPDAGRLFEVIVELTYLVQFKDLRADLQYPTQSTVFDQVGIDQESLT